MALFGGQRDVSLLYHINKELIQRIVDIQVLLYKLNVDQTTTNIYGEGVLKSYDTPQFVHALINYNPVDSTGDDYGVDVVQTAEFAFFRDDLKDTLDIMPEIGDLIEYDGLFFEIDNVNHLQYFMGRNDETWFGGTDHGYSISIICTAHRTKQSNLNIIPVRTGTQTIKSLPKNV